eukprot:403367013
MRTITEADEHGNLEGLQKAQDQVSKRRSDQPALHYIAHKAGMDSVDQNKIQQLIIDASKGSSYYRKEMERTQAAKDKAKLYSQKIEQHQKNEKLWEKTVKEVRQMIKEMERDRDLNRTWVHIDMDMFYAAVEIRDNPALANVPLAIGGESMISTANYVARKFGVRSAMPGFIAKKLCPDLVLVECNFKKYKEVSKVFQAILYEYDPHFESMGSDEANLDLTNYLITHNLNDEDNKLKVAEEIRTKIFEATQLTCSAGISCNKMLAKICTDMNKPNGQFYLKPDKEVILDFMGKLKVRKIPGIGRMTELVLQSLGIETCQQIIDKAPEIQIIFSEKTSYFLIRAALGIARNFHEEDDDDACQKSISVSTTFRPLYKLDQFKDKISEICEDLAQRMDKRKIGGLTITLELKSTEFNNVNKSMTLNRYIWTSEDMRTYCHQLLEMQWPFPAVRLIGVKMSNLKNLHEIKKDKSLNQFFNKGLSIDDYQKQNLTTLNQVSKKTSTTADQHQEKNLISESKQRQESKNKKLVGSSNQHKQHQAADSNKQKKISAFLTSKSTVQNQPNPAVDHSPSEEQKILQQSHDSKQPKLTNYNNLSFESFDEDAKFEEDEAEEIEDLIDHQTLQKSQTKQVSQTVQNTKKRVRPVITPTRTNTNAQQNSSNTKVKSTKPPTKQSHNKRRVKNNQQSDASMKSITSFFSKLE